MNNVFIAGLSGYLTDFLGIGIGATLAFLAYFFNKKKKIHIKKEFFFSLVFEFSSGLMMAIVTFRLIPDALLKCNMPLVLTGILAGLVFAFFIEKYSHIENKNMKLSFVMLINLWLHNIPEGFALGNSINDSMRIAMLFFIAVIIHNIPQGFLIALPLVSEKIKRKSLLYLFLLSGIPTAIGAIFGAGIGNILPAVTGFMLSFAAGSLLYALIFELSYEARKMYGRKIIEGAYILGLILGIIIT